jgi:hypothetical protein
MKSVLLIILLAVRTLTACQSAGGGAATGTSTVPALSTASTPVSPPGAPTPQPTANLRTVEAIRANAAKARASITATEATTVAAVETEASTGGVDRSSWHVYEDDRPGFSLEYPGTLSTTAGGAHIVFPSFGGMLNVLTTTIGGSGECLPPRLSTYPREIINPQSVRINGIEFARMDGYEAASGTLLTWQDYWINYQGACIVLDFGVYSVDGNASPTPATDLTKEVSEILATFHWRVF